MQHKKYEVAIMFLLFSFILLAGCGNSSASGQDSSPTITDPEILGEKIGASFIEMMTELTELLKTEPEIEQLKTQIAELKEKYINIFFEYGKAREAMSDADKAKVDQATLNKFGQIDTTMYNYYTDAVSDYRELDNDLGNELGDFNILSQYAFFELLKKQLPEEAERLGIQ